MINGATGTRQAGSDSHTFTLSGDAVGRQGAEGPIGAGVATQVARDTLVGISLNCIYDRMSNETTHPVRGSSYDTAPRIYVGATSAFAAAGAGASVTLAINGVAVSPVVFEQAGGATPSVYLVLTLLLLPLALALGHVVADDRSGGIYSAVKGDGRVGPFFTVSWLMVGGFLAFAGLLLRVAERHLDSLSRRLFEAAAPEATAWLLLGFLGLVLVFGERTQHGRPSATAWLLVFGVAAITAVLFLAEGPGARTPLPQGSRRQLPPVAALLLCGLWGLLPVFEQRQRLRRAEGDLARAAAICWLVPQAISWLFLLFLIRHLHLRPANLPTELDLAENRIELLLVAVAAGLVVAALAHMLRLGVRTVEDMARDGLLPERAVMAPGERLPTRGIVSVLLAAYLASLLSDDALAGLGAYSLALLASLLLLPALRTGGRRAAARNQPTPIAKSLLLWSGAGTALFALLALSTRQGLPLVGWLLLGLAIYSLYARRHAAGALGGGIAIATLTHDEDTVRLRHCVLVATGGISNSGLLAIGAALTRRQDGEMVVLQVLTDGAVDEEELREEAEAQWRALDEWVRAEATGVRSRTVVRLADTPAAGIKAAAEEYDADIVVLGWPAGGNGPEAVLEAVFRSVGRPLAVVSGGLPDDAADVRVATAGGPHAPAALQFGAAIAGHLDRRVRLFTAGPLSRCEEAQQILEATRRAADIKVDELDLIEGDGGAQHLADAGGQDLLVLGTSIDWLLGHAQLSGLPADVVGLRKAPTLLVKGAETGARLWARRLWQLVEGPLPTLSNAERASLLQSMRKASRASVDFFVLIVLAATIATLGLVLDSGAVIIGAMLVAPLMSPILALAHGLILGNAFMIRRSARSISQGMGLALCVGVVAALWLPEALPSSEMLARGEPSLLDLVVAVAAGAAAAYGVSRESVSAALPGVAISVALVPPLCVSGWALGTADFPLAGGAFLLFLTNLSAIVLVGAVTFVLLGVRPTRVHRSVRVRRALALAVLAIALISIPLSFQSRDSARVDLLESRLTTLIEEGRDDRARVTDLVVERHGDAITASATVFAFDRDLAPDLDALAKNLGDLAGMPVRVELTLIEASRLSDVGHAVQEEAPESEAEANGL